MGEDIVGEFVGDFDGGYDPPAHKCPQHCVQLEIRDSFSQHSRGRSKLLHCSVSTAAHGVGDTVGDSVCLTKRTRGFKQITFWSVEVVMLNSETVLP